MALTYQTDIPGLSVRNIDFPLTEDCILSQSIIDQQFSLSQVNHLKAAKLFQAAILTGYIDVSQPGIETIFLADLYRRAGDFQMADKILRQSKEIELEASLLKVLEYEQALIQAEDIDYYQIAEAIEA
ncbi:MAG: hypothetical protein WBA77_05490 [Microcoleaceae cyanobacterium]